MISNSSEGENGSCSSDRSTDTSNSSSTTNHYTLHQPWVWGSRDVCTEANRLYTVYTAEAMSTVIQLSFPASWPSYYHITLCPQANRPVLKPGTKPVWSNCLHPIYPTLIYTKPTVSHANGTGWNIHWELAQQLSLQIICIFLLSLHPTMEKGNSSLHLCTCGNDISGDTWRLLRVWIQ